MKSVESGAPKIKNATRENPKKKAKQKNNSELTHNNLSEWS